MNDLCENLWVNIISYITSIDSQHVAPSSSSTENGQKGCIRKKLYSSQNSEEEALKCTCTLLNEILSSDEYYQSKAMDKFGFRTKKNDGVVENNDDQECCSSKDQWPSVESVGGWKVLYENILCIYAPLEGLYTICNAWPWGLLMQCHFVNGKFCGDLVRPIPGRRESDGTCWCFKRLEDRVFEVTFKNGGMENCEMVIGNEGADVLDFGLSFEQVVFEEGVAKTFPYKHHGFLFKIVLSGSQNSTVNMNHNASHSTRRKFRWPSLQEFPQNWNENEGFPWASDIIEGNLKIFQRRELLLEPLKIPLMVNEYNPSMNRGISLTELQQISTASWPLLRSGFYAASYGSSIYSCLGYEIMDLSYIRVDTKNPMSIKEVFSSRQPPVSFYEKKGHTTSSRVFLVGRKITGDIHVPAGEITWFADVTGFNDTKMAPAIVEDEENGGRYRVVRSWNGLGTLSYPYLINPSWNDGWLLELEGNLYSFCWKKFQPQTKVIFKFPSSL